MTSPPPWIRLVIFTTACARGGEADTPALRGAVVAHEMGCDGCHGPGGSGGVADPGAVSGDVPGWRSSELYARDDEELREWILKGSLGRTDAERTGLIPMPAYEDHLSTAQVNDLLVWFKAVAGVVPAGEDAVYEGWKIGDRLGCFGCHGPGGRGGLANPGSFSGRVPPWDSADYHELVRSDAELREWILDGHPKRLWDNPAARLFLDGQATQMPAYRDVISEHELSRLTAYIQWVSQP